MPFKNNGYALLLEQFEVRSKAERRVVQVSRRPPAARAPGLPRRQHPHRVVHLLAAEPQWARGYHPNPTVYGVPFWRAFCGLGQMRSSSLLPLY